MVISPTPGLAFRTAANQGNLEQLQIIYKANPTVLDERGEKSGQTALHRATLKGHTAVVAWLLEMGADIHLEDNELKLSSYQLGMASTIPEINQLFLTAGFSQLSINKDYLVEGKAKLLNLTNKQALKTRLLESVQLADAYWANMDFISGGKSRMALRSLLMRFNAYWDASHRASLKVERDFLNSLLMGLTPSIEKESDFFASLKKDPVKARCFSDLCFMHAIVSYEKAVVEGETPSSTDQERLNICRNIYVCNSSFKRADAFYCSQAGNQSEYEALKKALIQGVYALNCTHDPLYMGFKEAQAHIARKNKHLKKIEETYHGQLIYNRNVHTQATIDPQVIQHLISALKAIKAGKQPRTQFIVDVIGCGHGLVLDAAFNTGKQQFEFICVEPAQMHLQHLFLENLLAQIKREVLGRYHVIAIQAALLKDMSSCHTYSLVLSTILSRLSFDQLMQNLSVAQPDFFNGREGVQREPLDNVVWKDVSALGQRVIMMGQSLKQMRTYLAAMLRQTPSTVDNLINGFLQAHRLPDSVFVPVELFNNVPSYIHYRRHRLRQRLEAKPAEGVARLVPSNKNKKF